MYKILLIAAIFLIGCGNVNVLQQQADLVTKENSAVVEPEVVQEPDILAEESAEYEQSLFGEGEIQVDDNIIDINQAFRYFGSGFEEQMGGQEALVEGVLFVPSGRRSDPDAPFDPNFFTIQVSRSRFVSFAPQTIDLETSWHDFDGEVVAVTGNIFPVRTPGSILLENVILQEK